MKGFFIIFQLIIFCVITSNVAILFFLVQLEVGQNYIYSILLSLAIIEFIGISFGIRYFFYTPIIGLESTIKNFLVGNLKDSEIKFKTSANPHLNYILTFFSKTLGTLKSIKSEFIHGKEIKGEVELGKDIQGKMLTKKLAQIPSLDIIIKSKPAAEIGGDSYDIIHQEDNYYIYVGDATGHGVGAGFIMMMVNSLVSGFSKIFKTGSTILVKTNEILKPRVKANLLMTMLLLRWNEKDKKMFMTGAGHEYLIIYKFKKKKCFMIKSGGVALGMIKDVSKLIQEKGLLFEENDIIVLYSDGITEAINSPKKDGNEKMFGEEKLVRAIEQTPINQFTQTKTAQGVFNNITIELSKFMGYKHVQLDDITLGVIHYKDPKINQEDVPQTYNKIPTDFITEWNW